MGEDATEEYNAEFDRLLDIWYQSSEDVEFDDIVKANGAPWFKKLFFAYKREKEKEREAGIFS